MKSAGQLPERRVEGGGKPWPAGGRGLAPWLLLLGGMLIAGGLEARLRAGRRRGLKDSPTYVAGQPAWVQYVMVGLGGFRGIIAETLWLRASRLQEQGRFFEQVQLAEWITALDPRATDAWVFNAWNLAYNISALMPRHEDRLAWVAAGVALLRDRALPANPREARLYRELGWLYQNKIGGDTDPAHMLFKLALAQSMSRLLDDGRPPPAGSAAAAELRASLHMAAERMREIEARLGALDWRLAESHAIYWAWSGLAHAQGFEIMACRRMIHQNLTASILRGTLAGDLDEGRMDFAPRLSLIAPAIAFYAETFSLFPGERRAYAIFLAFALRQRHLAGDEEGARAIYARLEKLAGHDFRLPDFADLVSQEHAGEGFFQPRGGAEE